MDQLDEEVKVQKGKKKTVKKEIKKLKEKLKILNDHAEDKNKKEKATKT